MKRLDRDRITFFRALADPLRLATLTLLATHDDLTVGDLRKLTRCSPSTLSNALARLERDGLIERERNGRAVRVRLRQPELARFLTRADAVVALAGAARRA